MAAFYRLLGARSPGGRLVERHGVVASVVPSCPAMTLELDRADLGGDRPAGIDWRRTGEVAAVAAINEAAYGLPAGQFARVLTALEASSADVYVARLDDEPAACVVAVHAQQDCGIFMVATVPRAQRRGLALALIRQALRDARERGATSSSLQATRFGRPLYERLGYRDLGAIDMWERRTS